MTSSFSADLAPRRTFLVVGAHPDDADFGVAGTAARLASEGHAVHYLVLSSGDAGTEDAEQSPEELMRLREAEQDAAGRILGLASTTYLRLPDGEIEPTVPLRKEIVRVIRRLKADIVLCQDPRMLAADDNTYLNHPDHRAAGQVTLDAVFPAAQNPAAFRELIAEGFPPHHVREVWLYFTNAERVNHWVDISDTFEQKIQALEAHESQIGEWARSGKMRAQITRWAEEDVKRRGLPYRAAESFQRIILVRDEEGPEAPTEAAALEEQATG